LQELPAIDKLQQTHKDKGLVVVTVSTEPRAELQAFAAQRPYSMVNTYLKDDAQPAAALISNLETQPVSVMVDRAGVIREVRAGGLDYEQLNALVEKYL
jgi:hypothetical protein